MVKPDFEGVIHAAHGDFLRSFTVEVMSYDHAEYRAAKTRISEAITAKGTCYLEHPAHARARTIEHDRSFECALARIGRRAIDKAHVLPKHRACGDPTTSRSAISRPSRSCSNTSPLRL